jgi:hypothetical protein
MNTPPTTLKEFADNEVEAYTAARKASQSALADAQKALADAQEQAQSDAAGLDKADQAVRAARAKLAGAELPADATKYADDLEQALAGLHTAGGKQLQSELALAEAQAAAAAAEASAAGLTQELTDLEAAQKAAEEDEKKTEKWAKAVGDLPLKTLDKDAATYLTSQEYKDADARLDDDFPPELRQRAESRLDYERKRRQRDEELVGKLQGDLDNGRAAHDGLAGEVAKDRTAYEQARSELEQFALEAPEWFSHAKGLIKGIKAAPTLTAAEKQRITRTDIVNAGKQAATLEDTRDKARDAYEDQLLQVEEARIDVLENAPDTKDPDAEPAVAALLGPLNTKEGELGNAENDLAQKRAALDTWEATVPDPSWQLLADFSEATYLLQALARTNPYTTSTAVADLADNVKTSEQKLAGSLQKQAEHERASEHIRRRLDAGSTRLQERARHQTALVFSVLRGDEG